jgi:hypothetical protein
MKRHAFAVSAASACPVTEAAHAAGPPTRGMNADAYFFRLALA